MRARLSRDPSRPAEKSVSRTGKSSLLNAQCFRDISGFRLGRGSCAIAFNSTRWPDIHGWGGQRWVSDGPMLKCNQHQRDIGGDPSAYRSGLGEGGGWQCVRAYSLLAWFRGLDHCEAEPTWQQVPATSVSWSISVVEGPSEAPHSEARGTGREEEDAG
jgi:hypothetical protein